MFHLTHVIFYFSRQLFIALLGSQLSRETYFTFVSRGVFIQHRQIDTHSPLWPISFKVRVIWPISYNFRRFRSSQITITRTNINSWCGRFQRLTSSANTWSCDCLYRCHTRGPAHSRYVVKPNVADCYRVGTKCDLSTSTEHKTHPRLFGTLAYNFEVIISIQNLITVAV